MKYLVQRVLILDYRSPHYQKSVDILVENGCIVQVDNSIPVSDKYTLIQGNKLVLSTAFVDINVTSGEPDNLEAETLTSLRQTASKGGFAYVAHLPSETKSIQSKADIYYLASENGDSLSRILPVGNISQAANHSQLSAMMDMKKAGAVAFSDGNQSSISVGMLKNALLYTKGFEAKLMLNPDKIEISNKGQINQGIMSVSLGYKGIPREAEFMAVQEIVNIVEYTETMALILNLTLSESLDIIQTANKKMKKIVTSTSSLYLGLDESRLKDYDQNFKLSPPLRSEKDRKKLVKACLDGKIEIIYSQHIPRTTEEKELEFDLASFGAINLQTSFQVTVEALGYEHIEKCIELMSINPAHYLGIELPVFDLNCRGEFVILDLDSKSTFSITESKSKSKNSPFWAHDFSTKVVGLIAHGREEFFDYYI